MFRRGWFLILCLLVSSLVATGSVCASDASGVAELSCGGVTDAHDGDGDRSPSDEEKGTLHHHSACHGHNVSVALAVSTLAPVLLTRTMPSPTAPARLTRRTIDPALRPPEA